MKTRLFLAMLAMSGIVAGMNLDWFTIDGGGGTSTSAGGIYRLSGTVGQPDAGAPMIGGSYTLTGGFWAGPEVVDTPGGPRLTITASGGNNYLLRWPAPSPGWRLEISDDLLTWRPMPGTPILVAGYYSVTINSPFSKYYFRLRGPG